jgi:hypothetical protein
LPIFRYLFLANFIANIPAQLGAVALELRVILSKLFATLLYLVSCIAVTLGGISNCLCALAGTRIEWAVFPHVNYLRVTLVLASRATVIMGMARVVAAVVMMMGIAAVRWRTMGMRAPSAMFVVTVMMPALTVTVFVIIIGVGGRHWTRKERAREQSS